MHCNSRASDPASVILRFNRDARTNFEVWQSVRCCLIAFLLLIPYANGPEVIFKTCVAMKFVDDDDDDDVNAVTLTVCSLSAVMWFGRGFWRQFSLSRTNLEVEPWMWKQKKNKNSELFARPTHDLRSVVHTKWLGRPNEGSGVTRVGVTWGGNWRCHPYFSPQNSHRYKVMTFF